MHLSYNTIVFFPLFNVLLDDEGVASPTEAGIRGESSHSEVESVLSNTSPEEESSEDDSLCTCDQGPPCNSHPLHEVVHTTEIELENDYIRKFKEWSGEYPGHLSPHHILMEGGGFPLFMPILKSGSGVSRTMRDVFVTDEKLNELRFQQYLNKSSYDELMRVSRLINRCIAIDTDEKLPQMLDTVCHMIKCLRTMVAEFCIEGKFMFDFVGLGTPSSDDVTRLQRFMAKYSNGATGMHGLAFTFFEKYKDYCEEIVATNTFQFRRAPEPPINRYGKQEQIDEEKIAGMQKYITFLQIDDGAPPVIQVYVIFGLVIIVKNVVCSEAAEAGWKRVRSFATTPEGKSEELDRICKPAVQDEGGECWQ